MVHAKPGGHGGVGDIRRYIVDAAAIDPGLLPRQYDLVGAQRCLAAGGQREAQGQQEGEAAGRHGVG